MSFSQGASTITQQLIKNEVLTNEKSIARKVKEQFLALNLEDTLEKQLGSKKAAKDYILELYLNTIALSHGLNGVCLLYTSFGLDQQNGTDCHSGNRTEADASVLRRRQKDSAGDGLW